MTDMGSNNFIISNEKLARYIFFTKRLRQDWTVRPDEFIPYPYPNLSVTRHLNLTDADLWNIGRRVAQQRAKPLLGRVDAHASNFERHGLQVVAAPIADNPNHANVMNWPAEKSAQKAIALEIAAEIGKAIPASR